MLQNLHGVNCLGVLNNVLYVFSLTFALFLRYCIIISLADRCKSCGIYGKSATFCTEIDMPLEQYKLWIQLGSIP